MFGIPVKTETKHKMQYIPYKSNTLSQGHYLMQAKRPCPFTSVFKFIRKYVYRI